MNDEIKAAIFQSTIGLNALVELLVARGVINLEDFTASLQAEYDRFNAKQGGNGARPTTH